jgi:hypothetical protein
MMNRLVFSALVGVVATGASACGGQVVTSLPPSDPVETNAAQFCSDAESYLVSLVPSIFPLICKEAVSSTTGSQCQSDFTTCMSAASAAESQSANLGSTFLPNCENTIAQCKVNVGQLSQCISDLGDALVALSNGITAESACAGGSTTSTNPFGNIAIPASCTSLPTGCPVVTTSVSVSGSGG